MIDLSCKNHHASVVEIENHGLLIIGASGSGKSTLALSLMESAIARGLTPFLISDDQVYLEKKDNYILASAPDTIFGNIEIAGFRVTSVKRCKPKTRIKLIIELVPHCNIERFSDKHIETVGMLQIEKIYGIEREEKITSRIIWAKMAEVFQIPPPWE